MSSSLVAGPQDVSSPFGGLLAIESGADLAEAIGNGDWTTGVLAGVGLALDTVATVIDPLGSVIAMGIGWVLEHVEPLRGWFNDLTGDAGEVAGFAQTWSNIANHLQQTGQKLNDQLNAVQDLNGQAMEAYRKVHEDAAKHVHAAGVWASGISGGMEAAGAIVQIVHDVTRDALSEVVGTACSAAIETACSFGLATPLAISQVTAKVSAMVAKVGRYIDDLITSITKLSKHLDDLMKIFNDAAGAFRSAIRGGGSSAPSSSALPGGSAGSPGSPSAPHSSSAPNSPTGPVLPKPGESPSSPSSPDSPNPADSPGTPPRSSESGSGSSSPDGDPGDGPSKGDSDSLPSETPTPNPDVQKGPTHRQYDDPADIPDDLRDHAAERAQAVENRQVAEADHAAQMDQFNQSMREAGLDPIDPQSMNSRSAAATIRRLQEELVDYPHLQDELADLQETAEARRIAHVEQRDAGEAFGEAAGRTVAESEGMQSILPDRTGAGQGTFDQAYKSQDGDLVIQETKGPSAELGTRNGNRQGSEAYLHDVLREDQALRDAVLADPALRQGLEDGSASVRYRMVQPDVAGNPKVTEFIINENTIDVPGWLRGN